MRIRLVIYGLAFLAITSALVGGLLYHHDINRNIAVNGRLQAALVARSVQAQIESHLEKYQTTALLLSHQHAVGRVLQRPNRVTRQVVQHMLSGVIRQGELQTVLLYQPQASASLVHAGASAGASGFNWRGDVAAIPDDASGVRFIDAADPAGRRVAAVATVNDHQDNYLGAILVAGSFDRLERRLTASITGHWLLVDAKSRVVAGAPTWRGGRLGSEIRTVGPEALPVAPDLNAVAPDQLIDAAGNRYWFHRQDVTAWPGFTVVGLVDEYQCYRACGMVFNGTRSLVIAGLCLGILVAAVLIVRFAHRAVADEKLVRDELAKSEGRFRELAEMLPETIFELDRNGTVIFVNQQAYKQFGYTKEDLQNGLNGFDLIDAADRERALQNSLRIYKGEKTGLNEYTALRKDGSRFPALFHSSLITDQGQPAGIRGFIIDITARKQMEDALRAERDQTRRIFKSSPSVICGITPDGTTTFINQTGERITGYTAEELVGRSWWQTLYPDQEHHQVETLLAALESEDVKAYEMTLTSRAGQKITIAWNSIVNRDDTGRIIEIIGFGQDITKAKHAEAKLRNSEAYLRMIMATIPAGVVVIDAKAGNIIDINPFGAKLFGYRPASLIGKDYHDFVCVDRIGLCPREIPCGDRGGSDVVLHPDSDHTIHVRRTHTRFPVGDREVVVQSLIDITDIKQLMRKQSISIDLSKSLLGLVNGRIARYTPLNPKLALFAQAQAARCYAEGGDHYFLRTIAADDEGRTGRTIVSLKDQSGHEVGCVLRSIITDLIHHELLDDRTLTMAQTMSCLNDRICELDSFATADFLTAITLEIDHASLTMHYAACGHPPFLLIRGREVRLIPDTDQAGGNLAIGMIGGVAFTAGRIQLQVGDRLVLYTDGLTEMPQRNRSFVINGERLGRMTHNVLDTQPVPKPVAIICQDLLQKIAALCDETVIPDGKNTSADDVTLIGLEVEAYNRCEQQVIRPHSVESLAGQIKTLAARISTEGARSGIDDAWQNFRLVLEESILNAWKHGHGEALDKPITVRWRFGNDLHLQVIDSGPGFDFNRLGNPTDPQGMTRSSGRGIYLMRHLTDQLWWEDHGRHIHLVFHRPLKPAAADIAPAGASDDG